MIGGEFDLSIGSMIGACGHDPGAALRRVWLESLAGRSSRLSVFALFFGVINGTLVLRTGLPSFIVTLGTLLIIRGVTVGITRQITGRTQVGGLNRLPGFERIAQRLRQRVSRSPAPGFPIAIVWWLGVAALATWVLLRTSFGNWIFGVGGNLQAAAQRGCPSLTGQDRRSS